ncbi:uncharacterized protein LOC144594757 [Rhinoraja longicauda]
MATEDNCKDLVFEGYLKKRKDKMCHLRGQYYIFTVQSVREIKDRSREYLFEMVMKNGKRKLLAAESSDLRAVWMQFLWKAMQLPGPGKRNSACTWHDIPHLIQRATSLCQDKSKRENSMGSLSSTDTQSEDNTSDTGHLSSSAACRQSFSASLDESYNMRSSNMTSSSEGGDPMDNDRDTSSQATADDQNKQEVETDDAPSPGAEAMDRAVQSDPEDPFASRPDLSLLDAIISDFRHSTSCWLDPTNAE